MRNLRTTHKMAVSLRARPWFLCRFSGLIHQPSLSTTVNNHPKDSIQYCQLQKRTLLRVGGADSVKLLQGLVTNNIELFHHDSSLKSMYSIFLNAQGRVLYDTIFYKVKRESGSPCFLIECDKNAALALSKHIKLYKLRSKVDISHVEDIFPWVVFSSNETEETILNHRPTANVESQIVRDPRVKELGWRLLLPGGISPIDCLEGVSEDQGGAYESHRAQLGVCEGAEEIPTGAALPLEYNLSFISGVSYQKGCYVGQELTARTHHTGVIRKRIMPFTFEPTTIPSGKLEPGMPIKTATGKASGKLCIVHGQYGLAMIRLERLKAGKQFIKVSEEQSIEICPYIPKWWPKEEHSA